MGSFFKGTLHKKLVRIQMMNEMDPYECTIQGIYEEITGDCFYLAEFIDGTRMRLAIGCVSWVMVLADHSEQTNLYEIK